MAIIPIVFVAISLAFPIWIYSNSKRETPHIPWATIETTLTKLVNENGGFPPCPTSSVTEIWRELCTSSAAAYQEPVGVAAERSARGVVFVCQIKNDSLSVHFTAQEDATAALNCGAPGGRNANHAPGFVFNYKGQLQSYEFDNVLGVRESFPVTNCHIKVERLKALKPEAPPPLEEFLDTLGGAAGDPQDLPGANRMCLSFDTDEAWTAWRNIYLR